jgi:hypothetical protein
LIDLWRALRKLSSPDQSLARRDFARERVEVEERVITPEELSLCENSIVGPEGAGAMRIVDAQIHLWGSGLPSNLSHRQVTSFTIEEALRMMDAANVDAAVIHPPDWDPNSTDLALKAARDFRLYSRICG